jgi:hypothetical protein
VVGGLFAITGGGCGRGRCGLKREVSRKDEGEQGNQDEKSRDVKEPVVVKMIPLGRTAVAVPFMRMVMVFTHGRLREALVGGKKDNFLYSIMKICR